MAVFFFDSSAIVKRYAGETGSDHVKDLTDPGAGNLIYLAGITEVEVISAIARRKREQSLTESDAQIGIEMFSDDLINQYRIIAITNELISRAAILVQTHILRAYDAVQLAAALQISRFYAGRMHFITFVSSDPPLNKAALVEGLTVDDPNSHP